MIFIRNLISLVLVFYAFLGFGIARVNAQTTSSEEHFLHQSYKKEHDNKNITTESAWDKLFGKSSVKFKGKYRLKSNIKVLGWHPHWKGSAYENYNLSLLTHIAYFSYDLNPKDGSYHSIYNWEKTKLIELAQRKGCKVLLAVNNFGKENNHLFLDNPESQKKMIATVMSLIKERSANGVAIDFEGLAKEDSNKFVTFISDLSTSLGQENKDYELIVALPGLKHHGSYDVSKLDAYVDLFVIMTYDYYGSWSKAAGPVAPLQGGDVWKKGNVEESIKIYLDTGVTPSKFLLGIPYYGAQWETKPADFPSKAIKFEGHQAYSEIKEAFKKKPFYDSTSQTVYYLTIEKEKNQSALPWFDVMQRSKKKQVQLWFDNPQSLGLKYDYVLKKQLGGIGIWALGFDDGYIDLWKVIAEKLSDSDMF